MYTVKSRVYGKATDGRTVLLYTPGTVITDDDAKHAGLLSGTASPKKPARGLSVKVSNQSWQPGSSVIARTEASGKRS